MVTPRRTSDEQRVYQALAGHEAWDEAAIFERIARGRDAYREGLERLSRIYEGLRVDANDGEFALWSEDDLVAALHAIPDLLAGSRAAEEPQP